MLHTGITKLMLYVRVIKYIGDFLDLMQERGIESQLTLDMVKKGRRNIEYLDHIGIFFFGLL